MGAPFNVRRPTNPAKILSRVAARQFCCRNWLGRSMQPRPRHHCNHAHIDRSNYISMIVQKCLPTLRRRLAASYHVFRDRWLGNFEAEHEELTVDSRCGHSRCSRVIRPDQVTQATINPWPPCPVLRPSAPTGLKPARCKRSTSELPGRDFASASAVQRAKKANLRNAHLPTTKCPPRDIHANCLREAATKPSLALLEVRTDKKVPEKPGQI